MPSIGKKGGRPVKYHTEEERKSAKRANNRRRYQSQRQQAQQAQQAQQTLQQQQPISGGLQIQFDPLSILQQAGPEEDGRITVPGQQVTAPDRGIPAEAFSDPGDEEQQRRLEVVIYLGLFLII